MTREEKIVDRIDHIVFTVASIEIEEPHHE